MKPKNFEKVRIDYDAKNDPASPPTRGQNGSHYLKEKIQIACQLIHHTNPKLILPRTPKPKQVKPVYIEKLPDTEFTKEIVFTPS
jgi:hypothetical protein